MNKENSIFRPEALEYKKNSWLGDFTVSMPSVLPMALWCVAGVLLVIILLLFTPYAQRIAVDGRVIYTPAAAEVAFNHDGIIGSIDVRQGDKIKKGDIIATLSRDVTYPGGGMNQALLNVAQHQITELQKREEEQHQEANEERQRLHEKISTKDREILVIKTAVGAALERNIYLKKRMALHQQLLQKGISTVQETIERENEYHNSVAQLNLYRISITRAQGERLQLVDELAQSVSQEKQFFTEIQRQKVTLQQQIISTTALVESHIVASLDGIIASMSIQENQRVIAGEIAAIVVPENARPFVEMWLTPPMLQEVKTGQHVLMRVASLPWEWCGKVHGTVIAISTSPEALKGDNRRFRVLIVPDDSTQILPVGVNVEADILTTQRYLWEWLFSPLKQSINRITAES